MAKTKAVGIDLGTTYSAMSYMDEAGKSKLIPNGEGDLVTPSVVLFEDDATIVGKEAKKVSVVKSDRVAICVKRDMGKPAYSKPIRGKFLPPEVIQSYILTKLRTDVAKSIGPDFQAIITVPAFFDEPRRKATYDAGEMAGLKVLDILNEPTAAALAFGESLGYLTKFGAPRERMNVVVYDLGGGTFDVTIIDMQAGDLRTICTDGDVQLGGHDWDLRLVDHFAEGFMKVHGEDPRTNPASMQRLLADAEETKLTLSARQSRKVKVVHNGKTADVETTREEFERRTADLLERTRFTTRNLLSTAGLQWKDIGRILVTGGSTRMPQVGKMLRELSGIEPDQTVNPDEAVARGAAIYANYLMAAKGETGHAPTFDVTNVNAHSLGVEGIDPQTMRKVNTILIPRNSPLPAKRTEQCMTQTLDQRTVVVQVLEGESSNPGECTPIGRTVIRDLPPNLPQGWPVVLTYEYGVNGRLTVNAKVQGTNREVKLELERDASMSRDRLAAWKRNIAQGGGLDAFDLAIQQELDQLKPTGPAGVMGGYATQLPSIPQTPSAPAVPVVPTLTGPRPGGLPTAHALPGQQSGAVPAYPGAVPTYPGSGASPAPLAVPTAYGQVPQTGPSASGVGLAPGASGSLPRLNSALLHGPGMSGIHSGVPTVGGTSPSGIGQGALGVPTVPTVPGAAPQLTLVGAGVPSLATGMGHPGAVPSGAMPQGMASAPRPGVAAGPLGMPGTSVGGSSSAPRPAIPPAAGSSVANQRRKPAASSTGTDLILYIIAITLGIMLGYYLLVFLVPSANFLNLSLPGVPPAVEASSAAGTTAPTTGTALPGSTAAPK